MKAVPGLIGLPFGPAYIHRDDAVTPIMEAYDITDEANADTPVGVIFYLVPNNHVSYAIVMGMDLETVKRHRGKTPGVNPILSLKVNEPCPEIEGHLGLNELIEGIVRANLPAINF